MEEIKKTVEDAEIVSETAIKDATEEVIEAKDNASPEEFLKSLTDAGLNLISTARGRLDAVVGDLVDKGKLSDEDGSSLLNSLFEGGGKIRDKIGETASDVRGKIQDRMDAPTGKDFKKMKKRIKKLEKEVAALKAMLAEK